jgi:hypothetical protein
MYLKVHIFVLVEIVGNCQWYIWWGNLLGRSITCSGTNSFIFKPKSVGLIAQNPVMLFVLKILFCKGVEKNLSLL